MNRTNNHDDRIARMIFASVYPHLLRGFEKKGRMDKRVDELARGRRLEQILRAEAT